MVRSFFLLLWHLPRSAIIAMIRLYQQTLSPDHGPLRHLYAYGYCRHEPTCSQYAIEQLGKRGFTAGVVLSFLRILSCNPFRKPSDEKLRNLADKILKTGS